MVVVSDCNVIFCYFLGGYFKLGFFWVFFLLICKRAEKKHFFHLCSVVFEDVDCCCNS